MQRLFLLLIILLPSIAWAAIPFPYDVPKDDASVRYLSYIFGQMGNLPIGQSANGNQLFAQLMGIFNKLAITIAILIIVYSAFVGTLRTAFEGEVLGKKWSIIWIPTRALVGISLLIPSSSGYSYIQLIIMWFILQGIGAANDIWAKVISFYTKGIPVSHAQLKNNNPPSGEEYNKAKVSEKALNEGWLLAGRHYRNLVMRDESPRNKYICEVDESKGEEPPEQCKGQENIIENHWPDTSPSLPKPEDMPFYDQFVTLMKVISKFMAAQELLQGGGGGGCDIDFPIIGDIKDFCLIWLPIVGCVWRPFGDIVNITTDFAWNFLQSFIGDFVDLYYAYKNIFSPGCFNFTETMLFNFDGFLSSLGIFNIIAEIPQRMVYEITNPNQDVLVNLANLGEWITQSIESLFIKIIAAVIALMYLASWGSGLSPIPYTAKAVLSIAIPIIIGGITLFWVMGITLQIYLPLIPYIVFLFAILGWFFLVIEAIIAAPFLSLMLIVPSEDEIGKAGHSLVILLGLILRPALLIVGFIFAIKLVNVSVHIISYGFTLSLEKITNAGSANYYGLFGMFAVIFLYVGLVTSVIHQSFSLIYKVPDKLLRWIGGSPEDHGEIAQQVKKVGGSAEKGAEMGKAGMSAVAGKLGSSFKDKKKGTGF